MTGPSTGPSTGPATGPGEGAGPVTLVGDGATERPCPGGPTLVRGAVAVVDAEGTRHEVTRPVVAVCACAKSSRMPWCDATHKSIRNA